MIRKPRTDDAARLAEIHTFAWRWAYRGLVPDKELFVDRTVEKASVRWKAMLEEARDVLVLEDGVVKGFVIQGLSRDPDAPGTWEVQALYVDPPFVREGCGTALLAASEEAGRQGGHRRADLWVLEDNHRARAFYEKCGYRPDGAVKIIEEWNAALELRYTKALD